MWFGRNWRHNRWVLSSGFGAACLNKISPTSIVLRWCEQRADGTFIIRLDSAQKLFSGDLDDFMLNVTYNLMEK